MYVNITCIFSQIKSFLANVLKIAHTLTLSFFFYLIYSFFRHIFTILSIFSAPDNGDLVSFSTLGRPMSKIHKI